jgi:thiol-disulfide isomerase/thioredoxin
MRKNVSTRLFLAIILFAGIVSVKAENPLVEENTNSGGVIHLNKSTFIEKVFDYEKNSEWKYKGDKPAIVDFYASWCVPCSKLSPLLDEIHN